MELDILDVILTFKIYILSVAIQRLEYKPKMIRRTSLPVGQDRQRKATVLYSTMSHDELQETLRSRSGSLDISISPVVSLKKRVPRFRRASKFFAAMHFVRKFSSLGQNEPNNMEIVTPFAQILTKLNSILRFLCPEPTTKLDNGNIEDSTDLVQINELELKTRLMNMEVSPKSGDIGDKDIQADKRKAYNDLVWCLDTLKKMQTHCSVSEMTINEFRKVIYEKQMSSESDVANEVFEFLKTYDLDNSENNSSGSVSTVNSRNQSVCSELGKRPSTTGSANSYQAEITSCENGNGNVEGSESADVFSIDSSKYEFNDLVKFDVLTSAQVMDGELTALLKTQDNWGMDIFRLSDLTNERPLSVLAYTIFKSRDLMSLLGIREHVFVKFFNSLEGSYRSNVPYHNYRHGADVMQSTHVLLNSKTLRNVFSPLEILSALFAAAIHDVDHPGVTNQYLVNTNSDLALMYNDISVLENHHLSTAFKLLKQEGCNIFENLAKDDWQKLRKLSIDIVLATDMSKHMTLLANMKTMIETQLVDTTKGGHLYLDNYSSKSLVLQNMVHCADLSNPTKPLALYRRWTSNILEEFFQQGDREREQGLSISPNCDRNKVSVNQSQIGFIDFIVRPVWETWADLVHPDVQEMLDVLEENRLWHEADSNALPKFSKVSSGSSFSDLKEENEM